jgi:enterochelin esterase-like enzyme
MPEITITWRDPDASSPSRDVLVRLVALTDRAYEAGDVSPYLMRPGPDGTWVWRADLPSDLRTAYQICPVRDQPLRGEPIDDSRWAAVIAGGRPDPACPDRLPPGCVWGNPDAAASVLSLPDAPPQPWVLRRAAVPRGSLERLTLPGGSLVHLYAPATARIGPTPLLVLFDGHALLATDVTATLDNLVADGVIEPPIAAIVESIQGSAPRGPSRVECLTRAASLESFVLDDLLPAVAARRPIDADPSRRILVGHSLGAVAALHLATRRPDQLGGVVAGSAALWWPGGNGHLSGADVAAAYLNAPGTSRLFLDVGTEEGDLLERSRAFHAELVGAGRTVTYREFRGGHDHACWRGSLADGIVDLLATSSLDGSQPRDAGPDRRHLGHGVDEVKGVVLP